MVNEKELLRQGWLKLNVIFEVVGNPKSYIEKSLKDYLASLKAEDGVEVLKEDYNPAEEINKGVFSAFVEAEMLVDGLEKLTWLCFNYSPASVEILKPLEFSFEARELQNWLNDLLAKLHEVGLVSKQVSSQNKLLVKNMNRLIKNSILLCVSLGLETPREVSERIGIDYKQLKPFFEALMREGKLVLEEGRYSEPAKKGKRSKRKE